MENTKNKYTFLLLGLLIGLAIGLMGMLIMKGQPNEDKTENAIERIANKVLTLLYLKKGSSKDSIDNKSTTQIVYVNPSSEKSQNRTNDSLTLTTDTNFNNDTLNTTIDSTETLNNITIEGGEEVDEIENVLVKKDEVIYVKNIEVIRIDKSNIKNQNDSLLEDVSGVQVSKQVTNKNNYTLEYWKSPINYKGYRLVRNKIVLFGLDPTENIDMKQMNNEIYLKYQNIVYKLNSYPDFHSYERVAQPAIYNLFKQ